SGWAYRAGQVAVVPVPPGVSQVAYHGPQTLEAKVRDGRAILPALSLVGDYVATTPVAWRYKHLPVNLLNGVESDLRPAGALKVGTAAVAGQAQGVAIRREIWPWFVWAALAVLCIEWLVYTRRMHL